MGLGFKHLKILVCVWSVNGAVVPGGTYSGPGTYIHFTDHTDTPPPKLAADMLLGYQSYK